MAEELEEDDEEYLLEQNPDLKPFFLVHLDKMLEKKILTSSELQLPKTSKKAWKESLDMESIEAQTQQCNERDLKELSEWVKFREDKEMESHKWVKKDDLQEVNLGKDGGEKMWK